MTSQPGKKVLVTGVASYIGIHVADQFLKAGYQVLGIVQIGERTDHIVKYFLKYGFGRFSIQEIGYPAEDNVYDFVVQGKLI
jgi:nucleoside-diphosphate-sugar epimerase